LSAARLARAPSGAATAGFGTAHVIAHGGTHFQMLDGMRAAEQDSADYRAGKMLTAVHRAGWQLPHIRSDRKPVFI